MKRTKKYVIAVDFDGTIVTNEYPDVGRVVPLAKEVINMLGENGHRCFLYTMRDGKSLEDAIECCRINGINMVGYNKSPRQFSSSPKQYGSYYIDDSSIGCPLSHNPYIKKPYVDWMAVAEHLTDLELLTTEQLTELTMNRYGRLTKPN